MNGSQEKKKLLVVVRTYPTPAKKGIEVSCTAGITEDRQWIRLFPVPYRFMEQDRRFRKYQWIEVAVRKTSDVRPESYGIYADTIEVFSEPLPTSNNWQARKDIVFPLKSHCLCCLKRERDEKQFPTLGFFRPRSIKRLIIEPDTPTWDQDQLYLLRQGQLFDKTPDEELEKVPFNFKYEFFCNETECPGHTLSCTDWEMGESWRRWKMTYGEQEWESKFRLRYETEMIQKNETHFYVGTVHQHPSTWIIVGLFYPPRPEVLPLFE